MLLSLALLLIVAGEFRLADTHETFPLLVLSTLLWVMSLLLSLMQIPFLIRAWILQLPSTKHHCLTFASTWLLFGIISAFQVVTGISLRV